MDMTKQRTVVVTLTFQGAPEWVAKSMERALVCPDRRYGTTFGRIQATLVSDATVDLTPPTEGQPS